jgi:tetratricopeptide (TPR) repeat protein
MRTISLTILLVICTDEVAHAGEKPPCERLLKGEDEKQAASLEKQWKDLWAAGKFADATVPAEKVLALRRRVQGAEHWEVADATRELDTLRKASRLPLDEQRELAEVLAIGSNAAHLYNTGRHLESEWLARKVLAVCQKLLGEDDPQTATEYNHVAFNLQAQVKYAEAESLFRRALAIRQMVLGEDHPDTASSYNFVAYNLQTQGKYADAEPFFRRALAIRRKVLGEEHPQTALSFSNLPYNLNAQGKYAEAEPLCRRALAIRQKVRGEDHLDTAQSYNNLAYNLNAQGKYAEAEPFYGRSLAIRQKVFGEDNVDTAMGYNNMGANLKAQGKYAEAELLYRRALAIFQKVLGQEHPDTARSYNSVAVGLAAQGKYAQAEPVYARALAIRQKVLGENHPETAQVYNNIAANLDAQDRCAEAEPIYRRALAIRQRALGEENPDTAMSYNNVAANLNAQGKYTEAEPLFRRALAIRQKLLGDDHLDTATSYNNLAANLTAQGNYADAEPLFRRAAAGMEAARLGFAGTGFERAIAMRIEPHMEWAACLARLERPAEAWRVAESGLGRGLLDDLTARALSTASPEEQQQRRSRAQRLAELDRLLVPLLSAVHLVDADAAQRVKLLAERQSLQEAIADEAAEEARRQVYTLERVQQRLAGDEAIVFWLDSASRRKVTDPGLWHWVCVVRSTGTPAWERLPPTGPGAAGADDTDDLPMRVRTALAGKSPDWIALVRRLATQRIAPLEPHLRASANLPAVTRLIVVPVGPMAGVPVELLASNYQVSYIPSGTVWARLTEAHRSLMGDSILAVGDPVFRGQDTAASPMPPDHGLLLAQVLPGSNAHTAGLRDGDVLLSYGGTPLRVRGDLQTRESGGAVLVQVWHAGKVDERTLPSGKLDVVLHAKPAPEALREQREFRKLLTAARGSAAKPLPGTRREINALAALVPADRGEVLLGSQASEQEIDRLAAAGRLKQFRLVHFATHGQVDAVSASRSALLLSNDRLPDEQEQVRGGSKVYTGRLTAEAMSKWELDADLVALSACDTALGKETGGEGFLGFAQVLFKAGTHALVLSRWKVDDTATTLFMVRFYQNLLGKRDGLKVPLGRAAALREAQHWLRDLPRSEAEKLAALISGGEVRGSISQLKPVARPPVVPTGDRPYAHPYYWSAFMLLGDPE